MLTDALSGAQDGDIAAQLAKVKTDLATAVKHSRTWEGRAKANTAAVEELARIKDAEKTDLQRATDAATAAEQRAADMTALYQRTLAAARYEIPPDLIGMITGATEDEANASAEALSAAINQRAAALAATAAPAAAPQGTAVTGRRPVESMRAGAAPAGTTSPVTGSSWLRDQYEALKQQ